MSGVLGEVLEANRRYSASFGEKGKLAFPPARRFAILTCMDARLDPAKFGYVYDVTTGELVEVEGAKKAGAVK